MAPTAPCLPTRWRSQVLVLITVLFLSFSGHAQWGACQIQGQVALEPKDYPWLFQAADTLELGITGFEVHVWEHGKMQSLDLLDSRAAQDSSQAMFWYLQRLNQRPTRLDLFWAPYLSDLQAEFALKKDSLALAYRRARYRLRYSSQHRSLDLQAQLMAKGRSKVLLSLHNFGLAADVVLYRGRRSLRNGVAYTQMGQKAKALALFWGGDFKGFPDPGHVQARENSADLMARKPWLRFEYDRFYGQYEQTVRQALLKGRSDLVLDSHAILQALSQGRMDKPCALPKPVPIPVDPELRAWIQAHSQTEARRLLYVKSSNLLGIQRGNSLYFFPLGLWR